MSIKKKSLKSLKEDYTYIKELLNEIENECLKKRIAHEIYTYASRARFYKKLYWICFFASLVFPILSSALQFGDGTIFRIFTVLFMGCATIAFSIVNGMKIREKWEHYRKFCEKMKSEISCCVNKVDGYENIESSSLENILAKKIELMIKIETAEWQEIKPDFPHCEKENFSIENEQKE